MAFALTCRAERKRIARLSSEAEARLAAEASLQQIWERTVLSDFDAALADSRTRELWWRGVPAKHRPEVWKKAVGNELHLSESSYSAALGRAQAEESRLQRLQSSGEEMGQHDGERWRSFERLHSDIADLGTFSEWTAFAGPDATDVGELHTALVNVLMAYSAYRSDVGYVSGLAGSAALMLLAGMNEADAFMTAANMWNRTIPMGFLLTTLRFRSQSQSADEEIRTPPQVESLYTQILRTMESKVPTLYTHFNGLDLAPSSFLSPLLSSLFTDPKLGVEKMMRLWDIMVFEGDKTLTRGIIAILHKFEGRLLVASRTEVLDLLGWNGNVQWTEKLGDTEEWIAAVKDAGKVDRKSDD